MVFHVVGLALLRHHFLVQPARLELRQDGVVAHAHDVRQHVESATVRHADDRTVGVLLGGHLQDHIQHGDQGVEPFDAESLLPQVGLVQESLEPFDGGQPLEQRPSLLSAERLPVLAGLDHAPQPRSLGVISDVLHLVGDRSAVGLAQLIEHHLEVVARDVDAQGRGRNPRQHAPLEAMEGGIQGGVAWRLATERVQARAEVTVDAVGVDQRHGGGHVCQVLGRGGDRRRGVRHVRRVRRELGGSPLLGRATEGGAERGAHGGKHVGVEGVQSAEGGLDPTQELPRFGPLDDAVVVGAGEGHEPLVATRSDGAGRHDRPLASHEPRDRGRGAQGAGIGERDRPPGQVVR